MARKKKAPAIKGNLRNLPDKKQRAIDRIGNIVTMIEVTNGTDIKAYELEPVYQEIGGGGGGDITTAQLTMINKNTLQGYYLSVANIYSDEFEEFSTYDVYITQADSNEAPTTLTVEVILYKGTANANWVVGNVPNDATISGDIETALVGYTISGDCSIVING